MGGRKGDDAGIKNEPDDDAVDDTDSSNGNSKDEGGTA
jgi:hypothetical protein